MSMPLPPDKIGAVSDLLARGQKIEAIKLYRELTGTGLQEAKEGVEKLEANLQRFVAPTAAAPAPALSDEKIGELSDLIFRGRKIEAIKVYRTMSGLGLKESKEGVEDLERTLRAASPEKFSAPPKGRGCLGAAAVLVLTGGMLAYVMFRALGPG